MIIGSIGIMIALGLTLAPSRQSYESSPETRRALSARPLGESASTTGSASRTSAKSEEAICAENLEAEVVRNKTSYEKGTILVSFERGTLESTISSVLKDHSLVFMSRSGTGTTSPQVWGTVKTSSGKEFETICVLRSDTRIKYAGLNPILELHE